MGGGTGFVRGKKMSQFALTFLAVGLGVLVGVIAGRLFLPHWNPLVFIGLGAFVGGVAAQLLLRRLRLS